MRGQDGFWGSCWRHRKQSSGSGERGVEPVVGVDLRELDVSESA